MISFIVIGKNEGKKLRRCFNSIYKTIAENQFTDYEIIYVDSNSSDNSIEIAKEYKTIRIFKLTGKCNAAKGRNTGAKESRGDILCFIDGDVEIMPSFFPLIYSEVKGLIYPFVSGKIVNYYYDYEEELEVKESELPALENTYTNLPNGPFFIISRKYWFSINGMRNEFKTGEDHDLGLRLAKRGLKLLVKREVAALHYTTDYLHKNRMWKDLFNGNQIYHRGLLYRKHIFNPFVYRKIIKNDYTLIILLVLVFITAISHNIIFLIPYLLLILVKGFLIGRRNSYSGLLQTLYFILRDIMNLLCFLFFYPKSLKDNHYMEIKQDIVYE